MSLFAIILLAFALAADAVTVSSTLGLKHHGIRPVFRISFHFGLFQALFPLFGALGGTIFLKYIEVWDHWFIFLVLSILGIRMMWDTVKKETEQAKEYDPTRKWHMIGLSVAVSIDAFGAGFALADSSIPIYWAVVIIGVITTFFSAIAMIAASFIRKFLGSKIQIVGGLILIGLGTHILISHLNG